MSSNYSFGQLEILTFIIKLDKSKITTKSWAKETRFLPAN